MSCHLVTGLPRNGKSFYCCSRIIDDLVQGDRNVYTNLPINPDHVARLAALRRYNRKTEYYLDLMEELLKRLHVFRSFGSRAELSGFRRLNPLWCRLHRYRRRDSDSSLLHTGRLLYPVELLSDYWNHTRANSVFYLDECYQIWNYLDSTDRTKDGKEKRKELQNYMRMHGHDGDDVFLITHKEKDLDSFILGTLAYRLEIRNSKYWPIVPQEIIDRYWWLSWLGTLRWPMQFFIIRTFIGDEKLPHRSFFKGCDKRIFKCYDSHSHPNGLKNRGFSLDNNKSTDFNKSYFSEVREWFGDAWPALLMMSFLVLFVIGIIQGLRQMISPVPKKSETVAAPMIPSVPVEQGGNVSSKMEPEKKEVVLKVLSVTPSTIYLSDGTFIRRLQPYVYEGKDYIVDFVSRDGVVLSRDGNRISVKIAELRK